MAPTVTLPLGGLAPNKLKLASGLFNLMRNLGGSIAIGIAACCTILNDHTNLYFLRIAERLSPPCAVGDPPAKVGAHDAALLGGDAAHARTSAPQQLRAPAYCEAMVMTFSITFTLNYVHFIAADAIVHSRPAPSRCKAADRECHIVA